MRKNKTVYILGAGSSYSANIPTQKNLLKLIYEINQSSFSYDLKAKTFFDIKYKVGEEELKEHYYDFNNNRIEIGLFILENFSDSTKLNKYLDLINYVGNVKAHTLEEKESINRYMEKAFNIVANIDVTLEDLFTIFDSTSSSREHYKGYSTEEINELNRKMQLCIIYAILYKITKECNTKDYDDFCDILIKLRKESKQEDDPLSIITTNWDDVLEKCLMAKCDKNNIRRIKRNKIYPDLCFYDYAISDSETRVPSINIKAKGYKNIKILKMHGSLSWLECPRCKRIFADYTKDIAVDEYGGIKCPKCSISINEEEEKPKLRSLIITPTFLKSLDSLNIRNIWQNAFMDLEDATKVVFIGYSLPAADFEMRCLLKKAIRSDAKIEVILSKNDDPNYYAKMLKGKLNSKQRGEIMKKIDFPEYRYKSFFGENNVAFKYSGFSSYVKELKKELKI